MMWAWLKRTFGGSSCVPHASQQVTLTPPTSTQQQCGFASSTPLPLGYASKAGSIYSSSTSQDTTVRAAVTVLTRKESASPQLALLLLC